MRVDYISARSTNPNVQLGNVGESWQLVYGKVENSGRIEMGIIFAVLFIYTQ